MTFKLWCWSKALLSGKLWAAITTFLGSNRLYNSQNHRTLPPSLGGKFSVISKIFFNVFSFLIITIFYIQLAGKHSDKKPRGSTS